MAKLTVDRANNPRRAFAEVVSLVAWHSDFDGKTGLADLFIDAQFDEGRVGGDLPSPIRFRLSLKQAEVHVIRDAVGVLAFPASTIARAQPVVGTRTTSVEKTGSAKASGSVSADAAALSFGATANVEGSGAVNYTDKAEISEAIGTMEVSHRSTPTGYAFVIRPRAGDRLKGPAWSTDQRRLAIQDTGHTRKRGEPPEARVELHCRREDLIIEDVEFIDDKTRPFWEFHKLAKLKQLAIEEYIKQELTKVGFDVGSVTDPFAKLVLADVSPERSPSIPEPPPTG